MNKKFLAMLLAFALLIGGAYLLYDQLSSQVQTQQLVIQSEPAPPADTQAAQEETAPALSPAPDFTAYDGAGNAVKLSDYFGKPLVLNFWASWCGPCKSEMPEFNKAYLELQEEVGFLMVNMTGQGETKETAMSYIQDHGFSFPVLYDLDSDAAVTYSVYSLPTTYFLDKDGNLVARATGAIDGETLMTGIDMIR